MNYPSQIYRIYYYDDGEIWGVPTLLARQCILYTRVYICNELIEETAQLILPMALLQTKCVSTRNAFRLGDTRFD